MMHPKLRWVMFAAALGLVACQGILLTLYGTEPTDSALLPGPCSSRKSDSVAIVTELFDEQGNKLTATFSGTSSDPAQLPVTLDNSFIPVYDANNQLVPPTDATRARFFVKWSRPHGRHSYLYFGRPDSDRSGGLVSKHGERRGNQFCRGLAFHHHPGLGRYSHA